MTEEKGPSIGVLRWRGYEVPSNQALLQAIDRKDNETIYEQEKAYILTLCATKNGCDMLMIVNGVCAHWQKDINPVRVARYMIEMTERGLLERKEGNYRVSTEAMDHMRGMLKDESKRPIIRSKA